VSAIGDAALAYAARGWAVFPCWWMGPSRKLPITKHGYKDATTEPRVITAWWRRWPRALIGTPTGHGFVVLDIDPRHGGFNTLTELGFPTLPVTLTAITGSGGRHLYFTPPPGREIRNTQGERGVGIGAGLDWRGVGGHVIVPAPGTGYEWVVETLALPLAPVPEALLPREQPPAAQIIGAAATCAELSPYGAAALRSAAEKILAAPDGEQEATLNGESYSIGRLAGAGGVPAELALEIVLTAGRAILSYNLRRPWRIADIDRKVRRAFAQGMAKPRPDWADFEIEFDRAQAEAVDVV
jgi:putative DNA primase/helicase